MGDIVLSLFLVVLAAGGFIYPLLHGWAVRRRGFDPEVWPHVAARYAALDRAALDEDDARLAGRDDHP